MEIGCGARVREFDGRRYFYFWHYQREGGRSRRKEDYVGRVDSNKARGDLLRRIAAYHGKAEQEFARRRARVAGWVLRGQTSTWRNTAQGLPEGSAEVLDEVLSGLDPHGQSEEGRRDAPDVTLH